MKWISVKERLPEDFQRVLVWDQDYEDQIIIGFCDLNDIYIKKFAWRDDKGFLINPSHWMELPEKPDESSLEGKLQPIIAKCQECKSMGSHELVKIEKTGKFYCDEHKQKHDLY